jgi:ferric-dicitrate binding protein FerR (iron transport regulator)
MEKNFKTVEDVLADETFLAWYFSESGETVQAWEKWVAAHPEQQLLVDEAVKFMSQVQLREKELSGDRVDLAAERLNVAVKMQRDATSVVSIERSRSRWWIPVAAAILILIAGGIFWKYSLSGKETITASYGQLSQNQLPDGSEVLLNANSSVILGKNWKDEGDREVWLKGEAFFHVKKTSSHNRFIVHAYQMDVIVTGTQFNITTRDNRNNVLLTEGSVTILAKDGKTLQMVPGDFVEIKDNKLEKRTANGDAILAWKNNQLLFESTPMTNVAKAINEHYGVKVTLADEGIKTETLSGIMANNNLDVLLRSLEAAKNYKITRTDNEITIAK